MTNQELKLRGHRAWISTLTNQGRMDEAQRFAAVNKLALDGSMLPGHPVLRAQERANAAAARRQAARSAEDQQGSAKSAATAATPGSAASASTAPVTVASVGGLAPTNQANCNVIALQQGGEGVSKFQADRNQDQSAPRGRNPQLEQAAGSEAIGLLAGSGERLGTVIAADAALLASPSGELEGDKALGQQENCKGIVKIVKTGEEDGWPEEVEGEVGVTGKNKFYCDIRVGDRWSKLDKGGLNLWKGERVLARRVWVSGDGRDAEYEVVKRLQVDRQQPEGPVQAPPVGYREQGNVGISHQTPVAAFQTATPPSATGLFQTGVQTINDQPKVVVFQTTTMEQIVSKERVGTLHASGKRGPMPKLEEYRSPVLDDVAQARPAEDGPAASDYIERIRQEAYATYMGQSVH